jgi:hypothetical protein
VAHHRSVKAITPPWPTERNTELFHVDLRLRWVGYSPNESVEVAPRCRWRPKDGQKGRRLMGP